MTETAVDNVTSEMIAAAKRVDRDGVDETERQTVLCAIYEAMRAVDPEWVRMREAVGEAVDLLLEKTHGNPARSAGHNARLALQAALQETPNAR